MLRGSILQTLVDSCRERTNQSPFSYGVYYKNTLVSLCHALEDSILAMDCQPIVMTAFQRGKWYLQEADRYAEISEKARHVTILASPDAGFAEHPTGQKDNVSLVSLLPEDPVAQEWHLVILSPTYTAMVMCQELTEEDYGPGGQPEDDVARKFYGFWTFESALIVETAGLMLDCCDRYDPSLRPILQPHVDEIANTLAQPDTSGLLGGTVSRVVSYLQERQQTLANDLLEDEHALGRNLNANELQAFLRMAQSIDLSDTANPMAASEVASLCEALGQLLDLPAWQIKRLRLAGMLHRIDYLPGTGQPLMAVTPDADDDRFAPFCPLPAGAQALRVMPKLRAIAQIVNHYTERWDGSGQPAGLSADTIPLESRILGLIAAFQRYAAEGALRQGLPDGEAIAAALERCKNETGTHWDPKLVESLQLLILGLQQGLSLPSGNFKISAGLWSLDDESFSTPATDSNVLSPRRS
ncbi:MAG: DICT sensory domain-containing protein [Geitlerinemataceae cyanobacterium]